MTHHKLVAQNWMAQCCWPSSDGESGLLLWVSRLVVGGPRRHRASFAQWHCRTPGMNYHLCAPVPDWLGCSGGGISLRSNAWAQALSLMVVRCGIGSDGDVRYAVPREACLCSFGVSWHKFCGTLSGLPPSARCLLSPHLSKKKKTELFVLWDCLRRTVH